MLYGSPKEKVEMIIREYAEECRCFTKNQAYYMCPGYPAEMVERVLRKMERDHKIYSGSLENDHFTTSRFDGFDATSARCLWPVLVHKEDAVIGETANYWLVKGKGPFAYSYLLNGAAYDVMYLNDNNKAGLIIIDRMYEEEREANSGEHKYIFVIDSEEYIDTLPVIEAPHLFAIIHEDNEESPVEFISDTAGEEAGEEG